MLLILGRFAPDTGGRIAFEIGAPWLFGVLIGSGEPAAIAWGYALGALLMLVAGGVAARLGVSAECKPLESVAPRLSRID